MVAIPLGTLDWESPNENVPRVKLRNMYLTENPTSPDGISRVSRPTLTARVGIGTGPIKGLWRQDGCFGGDYFCVSGTELYRLDRQTKLPTKLADLPGVGYAKFSAAAKRLIVVRDGVAYSYDGSLITTITFPDDIPNVPAIPLIQGVAVINGIFILTIKNSQRFYWLNPEDDDPDPLHFASAERLPDDIEAVAINSDEVWFIGKQGPEVWSPANDIDLPFQRINGRVYSDGCLNAETVVSSVLNSLPCLLWVSPEGAVVLAQGSVRKVSNESIEEAIRNSTNLRAWSFRLFRHDFYVLTSDQFTYCLDVSGGQWSRWDTYGRDNWLAHVGSQDGSKAFAGSSEDNRIWELIEGYDDDGLAVVREVSGLVANPGKPTQCASVAVRVNAGWSDSYTEEPVLELRWSDDQAATWSDYVFIGLGTKGYYAADTIFRSLGLIPRPGRVFEFRFSAKSRFRLDYATMNEV